MKKRILAMLLTVMMVCGLMPTTLAASSDDATKAAQSLYDLGLFQGTGTNADGTPNFDLDRTPTRAEAVTMLVRLLGKDDEAKAGTWTTPFADVAEWAKPYVGYAYANGLTTGTSTTTFGGDVTVNATQYLTFVLRALGYESGKDFQWNAAWEKTDTIGLTNGNYNADTKNFTRGDVAIISQKAIEIKKAPAPTPADTGLDAPAILTVTEAKNGLLVWWREVPDASGYEMWTKSNISDEWNMESSVGGALNPLQYQGDVVKAGIIFKYSGLTFSIKVRAYKTGSDGSKIYSDFSNIATAVYP